MARHAFGLQRHEFAVEGVDVILVQRAAEAGPPAGVDVGVPAEGLDVLPFSQPHRPARFLDRDPKAEDALEGFGENENRGAGTEIDGGSGPVENHRFGAGGRRHAKTSGRETKGMIAARRRRHAGRRPASSPMPQEYAVSTSPAPITTSTPKAMRRIVVGASGGG